ncbi:helix-turn-helix transcriptional regulator [uncultured Sphingomonas sp.]|uniref:helix-turn-helix domain-containing protein n=1 Tax=uncultured Sphingomonas sp. TaxID=158754 RepID=UPI0025D91000|nr:helix-turn-helix transcriptional regulator [uncultured Sphingomonas sp.]
MSAERLSPRQRECLRLVWERQATSKEIGAALGISSKTVDSHIEAAVALLGAADRRNAARIAFGERAGSDPGWEAPPVAELPPNTASTVASKGASRPWETSGRRNDLTLGQTLKWIVAIGLGSLCALSLAISVGNGLRPLALPVLDALDRLTR